MQIDLSKLNGKNGFVINGIATIDNSGRAVSGAGDVNGDGKDDLFIGAPGASPNGDTNAGESFVVFGKSHFDATLELADLDGSNGFMINGLDPGDELGISLSRARDVNGDGIDDLIIGANHADPNGVNNAGESYVVFGKNHFNATLALTNLDGSNGFVIIGIDPDDGSGRAVSSAGDVNGDNMDDLIIGAFTADSYTGASYVVFGRSSFDATLELADLDGSNGFAISGIDPSDSFGRSVSGAGDVNGDGMDDLIIGAPGVDNDGASYVVFGKSHFNATLELANLDGSNGFVINAAYDGDRSGISVSGAGDVNGDGKDDLIIGAELADPNGIDQAGASYVVFGKRIFTATLELENLDGSNGFVINGIAEEDYSGCSVSGAGDVNDDGKADLIIGAYGADPNGNSKAGESYVVFGKSHFDAELELATLTDSQGLVINGIDTNDNSGYAVSRAGDVNGDGAADLIIGAYNADPGGVFAAGESYVIFGTPQDDSSAAALSSIISNVKEIVGQVYEQVSKPLGWLQRWYQTEPNADLTVKPLSETAQQLKEAIKSYALERDKMTGLAKTEFGELENKIQAALTQEPVNEKLLKHLHRELEKHESRYGHAESMTDIYQRLYGKPSQQRNDQVRFFKPVLPQAAAVVVPESLTPSALPMTASIAQLGNC